MGKIFKRMVGTELVNKLNQGMSPSCPHPIVVTVDVLLSPSYRGMCPSCPHLLAAAPDIVQGHVPITFLYRDDAYPRQVIPP